MLAISCDRLRPQVRTRQKNNRKGGEKFFSNGLLDFSGSRCRNQDLILRWYNINYMSIIYQWIELVTPRPRRIPRGGTCTPFANLDSYIFRSRDSNHFSSFRWSLSCVIEPQEWHSIIQEYILRCHCHRALICWPSKRSIK